ncbi:hypothetical protein NIES3974_40460 [Calothrix sp. NIES-3974]|nr:hypothetical protein NIES3974_40460 [Calothrix sp. NIES-3974]
MGMFKKILVAVEDNDIGMQVFQEGLAIASQANASLMLLSVISPYDERYINPIAMDPYSFYPTLHSEAVRVNLQQWDALQDQMMEFLNSLGQTAAKEGVEAEYTLNVGDPGRVICHVAANWNADLILVGRRGRKGLSEFFLGSVSNYVLHHAPCSVLVVQGLHPSPEKKSVASNQELQVG